MKIHSRERGRHRSAALRVLALLLVFNFHFLGAMFGGDAGAVPLVFRMLGSLGTCMFLVLVGVVAQAQLNSFSGQARPYWIKRFWRLYPPYFGWLRST